MARGVSTVLDVSVCLLLVGAAMTTLAVGIPDGGRNTPDPSAADADASAHMLATVTAGVSGPNNRTAHGTLAGHLARAAVANASLDGNALSKGAYADAVAAETTETTDRRVAVTARWEPYPDAPLRGTATAGPAPPADAEVAVTRHVVATGIEPPTDAASFEILAQQFARAYVDWCFPPERTRAVLVDGRTAPRVADRYRAMAESLDTEVGFEALADANTERANARLAAALAERLEADLRSRYDTPRAAADASAPDRAVIVVRRWEA